MIAFTKGIWHKWYRIKPSKIINQIFDRDRYLGNIDGQNKIEVGLRSKQFNQWIYFHQFFTLIIVKGKRGSEYFVHFFQISYYHLFLFIREILSYHLHIYLYLSYLHILTDEDILKDPQQIGSIIFRLFFILTAISLHQYQKCCWRAPFWANPSRGLW